MSARAENRYDGDASITPSGQKFRVFVEGPNFRGEVYIDREKAVEILSGLAFDLRHHPKAIEAMRGSW